MNRVLITGLLALSMIAGLGCATRKYVRKQTEPLKEKVGQLETATTQNSSQMIRSWMTTNRASRA